MEDKAPEESPANAARVRVLFPLPFDKTYDYRAQTPLAPGTWVRAPFGGTMAIGVVWPSGPPEAIEESRLKAIETPLPASPLAPEVLSFVAWVAAYTMFPLGSVLRLVMRSGDGLETPAGRRVVAATGAALRRETPARRAVLDALGDETLAPAALAERAGVSDAVIRGLIEAGALRSIVVDADPPFPVPRIAGDAGRLSPAQAAALGDIRRELSAGPRAILLDGVTGAGKTEVYLEAAADALAADATSQVLVMLPEIALTLPFLTRIKDRFAAEPAAWHSDLSAAARRRVWRRVNEGQARLVVGARSALFLPYRNLRLVIVDEEHEGAYKQEDGVTYQARDMAVARGALARFPVILASATPSLETVVNVDQGRYGLARLTARYGSARLPAISLIDLRKTPPENGRWLSPPLVAGVDARLAAGEQTLLFINRRGYAPLTICRKCGARMKAPHSDTWLVEHRFENRLVCHHTGFSMPKPDACPTCGAVGALSACGPGIERIAEEAAARWPSARLSVLSSDHVQSPRDMRAVLDAMQAGEIDILVATQMVAKGHHFPKLTLVGVVDADMGLAGGDLRSAERTYQLLSQVAGRAGRAAAPGEAMVQTHAPEASVFAALAAGDRDAFLAAEAAGRSELGFPPFGRLASVVLRSDDEKRLRAAAETHRAALVRGDGVEVWGPAPAPIFRLRGEARMRFLVKARRDVHVQAYLDAWLKQVKLPSGVRRTVDIDPYNFL